MRGILLISHGTLAKALGESLKMIAGETTNVHSVCLEPTDSPESFSKKLDVVKPDLDAYDNLLVFADLFGGSPCNTTLQYYYNTPNVEIISGMNFSMVLSAILNEEMTVAELIATGKEAIVDVREFSRMMMSSADEDE